LTLAKLFAKNTKYETERLMIRKIIPEDTDDMFSYASRPETSKYLLWEPHPSSAYTADLIHYLQKEYVSGRYGDYAIILKETGRMIGTVGFTSFDEKNSVAEVGYVISPDYWHRGIATEALKTVLSIAFFDLGAQRVEAKYIPDNVFSRKVMEKCGLTYEGTARGKMLIKGIRRDIAYCSILREEYFAAYHEKQHREVSHARGIFQILSFGHKS